MGIGTSLGAYFETNLDHHAGNEYLLNPNSTPDNNELSPNVIMPPAEDDVALAGDQPIAIPIANITNTPGEILEGLEGTRVFGSGYGVPGPTQMRRPANSNEELYSPRDKNMVGSKAVDDQIMQSWTAMAHRHERGNEIINKQKQLMDVLDKRPWSDLERFKYKQLDKEHELLFNPDGNLE